MKAGTSEITNIICTLVKIHMIPNMPMSPNPKTAGGGGHYGPPLYIFVDNFFIVERIDLKFGVNSYLSFLDHMKIFWVRFGS